MSFLSFLGFQKMVQDGADVLEFPKPKLVEPTQPIPPRPVVPKAEEHYRVGFDTDGRTTLTMLGRDGASMTLSMTQPACEQLIKMLRSTYQDDFTPDNDPDGGLPLPEEERKVA